jgi:PIN domain nuclease of toxin-antitoxin system
MTLLLDTHTVLWMTEDLPNLGRRARSACNAALAADEIAIASIVFFEAAWLLKCGRVTGPSTAREWRSRLLSLGLREIPLSAEIAMLAAELEDLHGDPLDRIIVATTLAERGTLLTADRQILAWPGQMLRQDARR